MSPEEIGAALQALDDELARQEVRGEICLDGGAVPAERVNPATRFFIEELLEAP